MLGISDILQVFRQQWEMRGLNIPDTAKAYKKIA